MSVTDITTLGNRLAIYQTKNLGFTRLFMGMGSNLTLHLHEGGLLHEGKNGTQTYHWDELESFSLAVETSSKPMFSHLNKSKLTLKTTSGQTFVLDNYFRSTVAAFNQFLEILPRVAMNSLAERSLRQINSGQEAQFGPLRLATSGIRYKNKELPWSDLSEVRTKVGGCYAISSYNSTKGKPQQFWAGCNIPNYSAFEQIIARFAPNAKIVKVV